MGLGLELGIYILLTEVLSLLSSLLFLIISIVFIRFYRLYSDFIWIKLFTGFILLSMSQLTLFIGLTYGEASVSYAIYTTSPALAFSGGYMILSSQRRVVKEINIALIISPITLLPMVFDVLASVIFFLASLGSRGYVRIGMIILAVAYLGRGLWIISPDPFAHIYLLLASELIRCIGAVAMTIAYVRRSI